MGWGWVTLEHFITPLRDYQKRLEPKWYCGMNEIVLTILSPFGILWEKMFDQTV